MYVRLTEVAAGLLVKNVGEQTTPYLIITMHKRLLNNNLFKNKDYGTYCRNASIDYEPSFKEAKKTLKELRESLSKDYKVIMVQAKLTRKK